MKLSKLVGAVCGLLGVLSVHPARAAIQAESVLDWNSFEVLVFPLADAVPVFAWVAGSQLQGVFGNAYSSAEPGVYTTDSSSDWSTPLDALAATGHAQGRGSIVVEEGNEFLRSRAYSEPSAACPDPSACSGTNSAYAGGIFYYGAQRVASFTVSAPAAIAFRVRYLFDIAGGPVAPGDTSYVAAYLNAAFSSSNGSGGYSTGTDGRSLSWSGVEPFPVDDEGTLYAGVVAGGPGTGSFWAQTYASTSSVVNVIPEPRAWLLLLSGLTLVAFVGTRRTPTSLAY
jgi:hypothetical protein